MVRVEWVAAVSAVQMAFQGGDRLKAVLAQMAENVQDGPRGVRVGFLESATYPIGPRTVTTSFKNGKVRRAKPRVVNSGGLHVATVAFWNEFGTVRTPPRPFFRLTIRRESPQWGELLGKALVQYRYQTTLAFKAIGRIIKEQLQATIVQWPADNAASTVARKGFDHGLLDTAVMLRSVDYETIDGS